MADTAREPGRAPDREAPDSPMLALANAMTRLYKDLFGRGPTKVRASFAGPDTVIVTLENTFTQAERNMVAMGEHQRLRDVRLFFQHSSEGELKRPVEEILGRRVRGFISGIDTHQDIAVEVYVLEPESAGQSG
jgi:uncharacterized protein YbcI